MDCLVAKLFLNSCFSDTVFVILLRTAVETAVRVAHKLLRTGDLLLVRERGNSNLNSKTLFDKDCSLGSVRNLSNNQSLLSY